MDIDGILGEGPWPVFEPGWVWLCGAGPGDPGLLTLHALNGLRQADVVVHDALVNQRILDWTRPDAERVFAGKRGGKPSARQRDISLRLVELARDGRRVLRLKGGDPFVFGRGGEEALALVRNAIPIRIVPGISAGIGGLAYAGIPLTHRDVNQSVTFVTGHDQNGQAPNALDWSAIARGSQVIVLYMATRHIARIAAALMEAGRSPARARRGRRLGNDAGAAGGRDDPRRHRAGHPRPRHRAPDDHLRRQIGSPAPDARLDTHARRHAAPASRPAGGADGRGILNRGLVFAAPASGCGKTVAMLAVLAALRNRGIRARSAKSGPDYIDPGYHAAASGEPCINLDAWAMPAGRIRELTAGDGVLLVEGAMGLFDGAPPDGRGSTADLAEILGLPVVLVVDASRQSQSVAALYGGFANFRESVDLEGVILNRVAGSRHEKALRRALATAGARVMGAVPSAETLTLASRHLGLRQARERADLEAFLERAAATAERRIDIDMLLAAAAIPAGGDAGPSPPGIPPPGQRIAVAEDAAFTFTYPHLLRNWRAAGAEIGFFSPLADETPAPGADIVILPGGYPELHAGRLAAAARFRASMSTAPAVYGECGGYMVMGDGLVDAGGARHRMLGLLRLETSFEERRLHIGYRKLTALGGPFRGDFTGHEFHYSTTLASAGEPLFAARNAEGIELPAAGLCNGRAAGSFVHLIDRGHPTP